LSFSLDVALVGFAGYDRGITVPENITAFFGNQTTSLERPPLNIAAFFLPRRLEPLVYGWSWQDLVTGKFSFRDNKNIAYHDKQGQIYSLRSILATGACQPVMKPCDENNNSNNINNNT